MKSLKQNLTSAVNEFQEASQDVWRELENAGDPVRTKVKTRQASETFSVSAIIPGQFDLVGDQGSYYYPCCQSGPLIWFAGRVIKSETLNF